MMAYLKNLAVLNVLLLLNLMNTIFCTAENSLDIQALNDFRDAKDDFLLVHTLNGDLILVDRKSGTVRWVKNLGPVLLASYDGGPVLIADPLDARLYEYSDEVSADILRHLDHSIMGYVRRSPTYYKQFVSFGSKVDFWMSVDLNTGQLLQSASQDFVLQCPGHLNSSTTNGTEDREGDEVLIDDLIGIGRTQYNLLFRDPITGMAKLNLTYTTFATHTDPDDQNDGLRHIATTQPGLLTFEGQKLIWHLPLTSPVVGLFTVWTPLPKPAVPTNECVEVKSRHVTDNPDGDNTAVVVEVVEPTNHTTIQCNKTTVGSSSVLSRILRRVEFTTYALDMSDEVLSTDQERSTIQRLEYKLNGPLELAPSLLVSSSPSAPLYAIACLAEASLQLRGIRRASELFMIEGPSIASPTRPSSGQADGSSDDATFPASLIGLYELPPHPPKSWTNWDYTRGKRATASRFPQLAGPEFGHSNWIPTSRPGLPGTDSGPKELYQGWFTANIYTSVVIILACLTCGWLFIQCSHKYKLSLFTGQWMVNKDSLAVDLSFLPSHFDTPDSSGWAGCTAEEAGQPEAIRINLNEVLGQGANGTMVFAGTFGSHQTAVKRIVRQPQLEKHWRREHAILLRHHHPHLIRCYWTGSTANFHYLVMQRCATTLSELLRRSDGAQSGFDAWGLTPCAVIHQVMLAVACLHQNRIVHRDLKPSNVLIATGESGGSARVVVGDFGLSRPMPPGRTDLTNSFGPHVIPSVHEPGHRQNLLTNAPLMPGSSVAYACAHANPVTDPVSDLTSVGVTFGTLGWMAPELCDPNTGRLTYAIDIFACGLLAYHILTSGRHPYDRSDNSDSEQPSLKVDTGSSSSDQRSPSVSDVGSNRNVDRPGSSSVEATEAPFCYSTATRLSRHHARQLAIAENRPPALHRLTESDNPVDVAKGFLGRQLIQCMLSHNPQDRPSAEEITHYPLFWPASKVMRFLSELSDLLDTREGDLLPNGLRRKPPNMAPRARLSSPMPGRFFAERRALLDSMETYAPWVFNEHWFYRLEPEVVQDLLATRGYQDTSLMDLLRAIRNKHNHLWHLQPHIRVLLGNTQEGMANYWTSRFPSLVPLLYGLSRHYLTGFNVFVEFLPPSSPSTSAPSAVPSDFVSDWWRTAYSPPAKLFPSSNPETYESMDHVATRNGSYGAQLSSPFSMRQSEVVKPWKRGQVVSALNSPIASTSPRAARRPPVSSDQESVVAPVELTSNPVSESLVEEAVSETPETDPFIVKRARRRPNQPKKIRPSKKQGKAARERLEVIARSGCELMPVIDDFQ